MSVTIPEVSDHKLRVETYEFDTGLHRGFSTQVWRTEAEGGAAIDLVSTQVFGGTSLVGVVVTGASANLLVPLKRARMDTSRSQRRQWRRRRRSQESGVQEVSKALRL